MIIKKSSSIISFCLNKVTIFFPVFLLLPSLCISSPHEANGETLRYHTLVVDAEDKILPWYTPAEKAYDHYLDQLKALLQLQILFQIYEGIDSFGLDE